MTAAAASDPVRAQVEATLRQMVDVATAVPCELARRTWDTALGVAGRVTETVSTSVGLARSVGELALGGLFGIGASTATTPLAEHLPSVLPTPSARPDVATERKHAPRGGRATSSAAELPLEGYESLAASHVVARLTRLSAEELVQVREFEQAHRGRRTILGKIEQLLAR